MPKLVRVTQPVACGFEGSFDLDIVGQEVELLQEGPIDNPMLELLNITTYKVIAVSKATLNKDELAACEHPHSLEDLELVEAFEVPEGFIAVLADNTEVEDVA